MAVNQAREAASVALPILRLDLGRGWSAEEIVLHYPYLSLAEVYAALGYYHDHQLEMDLELAAERTEAERARSAAPVTPLLARLRARKAQPA